MEEGHKKLKATLLHHWPTTITRYLRTCGIYMHSHALIRIYLNNTLAVLNMNDHILTMPHVLMCADP